MVYRTRVLATALSICIGSVAQAQNTINFDNLADGTVVTNQYAGVMFSSSQGFVNYITTQPQYNASKPNFICSGPANSGISCTAPTFIDFISAVTGVSIKGLGINDVGIVAQAHLYNGGVHAGTVFINGNAEGFNPVFLDFSSYGALTRIELLNITDAAGIGWDDLTYTTGPNNVVPEPASLVLVAAGLAGLALARRRFAR